MALLDNVFDNVTGARREKRPSVLVGHQNTPKSLPDSELSLGRNESQLGRNDPSSVLTLGDSGSSGNPGCLGCHSTRFWFDSIGDRHCETCNPPAIEAFVVSRVDLATTQLANPTTPPANQPPPDPINPAHLITRSIFTERQWEIASLRLARKVAEREALAADPNHGKKTQAKLTSADLTAIAAARSILHQIEAGATPDPSPITFATPTLGTYRTIASATDWLRRTTAYLLRDPAPPDLSQRLDDLDDFMQIIKPEPSTPVSVEVASR